MIKELCDRCEKEVSQAAKIVIERNPRPLSDLQEKYVVCGWPCAAGLAAQRQGKLAGAIVIPAYPDRKKKRRKG